MTGTPPHLVILASAGTGKTHRLTSRFLALIAAGESAERILATTFTRKAAGEILRKIVSRLADAAASPAEAKKLGADIGVPVLTPAQSLRLLGALARSLDRLSIGTIDSFFARLAGGNTLSIGGAEWRMIDEDEDSDLRFEAVSRVLQAGAKSGLMDLVRHRHPGMAGRSVHTDVLVAVDQAHREYLSSEREAWGALVVPPPMTEAALTTALDALRAMPVPVTRANTPHALWWRAKEKAVEAARTGRWDEFIDAGPVGKLICGDDAYHGQPITAPMRAVLGPLIAHAGAALLAPLPARNLATWEMLDRFDAAYRSLKESRGVCTFDDVPRMLLALAATGSMQEIYYRLDAKLHHVLLDEFQDTSVVQWRLLEPIVDEIVSQEGERSFLCVGDVKQSLYSWRRAEPELLPSIPRRWPHVPGEQLLSSYRSSQVVIDAVNEVMGGMNGNPAIDGPRLNDGTRNAVVRWNQMFRPHSTNKVLPGYCRLSVSPAETDTMSLKDGALQAAAARVKELHDGAPHISIGVLFRSRAMIAPMKLELARLGIHASEEGGNPLAESPAVAAVLSMLTLTDHPGNTAALFHVATSPLGPVVGLDFETKGADAARVASGVRLRLLAEGFAGVLEDWFRKIAPACSHRDARRLDQLVSLGVHFDERSRLDPSTRSSAFVEFVKRRRVEDPSAAPVRLMTVHASKGLEFDAVVLPWLDDRIADKAPAVLEDRPENDPLAPATMVTLCPARAVIPLHPDLARLFDRWRAREVLEELCVLYVALTRAVHCIEMFVPPAEKPLHDDEGKSLTFAKIVRGALNTGAAIPGDTLWLHGDPGWMRRLVPEPEPLLPWHTAHDLPTLRLDLDDAARSRHLPRRSPAADFTFEGRGGWPGLDPSAQSAARARGVLFHAWLELIEWIESGVPDDTRLREAAARSALPPDIELGRLTEEFRAALERQSIRKVLSRASYPGAAVEVRRELAFSGVESAGGAKTEVLVVGRIDRLVVVRDANGSVVRAEVIDFKTDQLADAAPSALALHAESYRAQMADYRTRAARLLGCPEERVSTKLLFITHDAIIDASPRQKETGPRP